MSVSLSLEHALARIPLLGSIMSGQTGAEKFLGKMVSVFFKALGDFSNPSGPKIDITQSACLVSGTPGWNQEIICNLYNIDATLPKGVLKIEDQINIVKLRHCDDEKKCVSLRIYRDPQEYRAISLISECNLREYTIPPEGDDSVICGECDGLKSRNCTNPDLESGLYQDFLRRDELAKSCLENLNIDGRPYINFSLRQSVGLGILLFPAVIKLGLIAYRTFIQKENNTKPERGAIPNLLPFNCSDIDFVQSRNIESKPVDIMTNVVNAEPVNSETIKDLRNELNEDPKNLKYHPKLIS